MYSSNTITTSASMTKKKKPIHKKNNKRKTVKLSTESDSSQNRPLTWVEKISWQLVETALPPPPATTSFVPSFTVVSWNVLAEAYTTRRSHPHLPLSYQSVVFDRRKRRALLQQTLHRLATMADGGVDIFCLQEVDLPEQVTHYLQHSLGYQACQTPTNKAGGGIAGRVDACAICFSTRQFEFLDYDRFPPQVVHLDDIASLGRTKPTATRRSASSSLACSGLSSSFLRHNMALMVALRHKSTQQPVVLVNAHLYWHPGFEYVKLCQMHHVLQQATTFAADISSKSSLPPTNGDDRAKPAIIVCGDLNSLPKSSVHQYLTQGTVNAKRIAPWRFFWNPLPYDDEEGDDDEEDPADDAKHLRCQEEEDNDEGEDEVEDDEVSDLDEQESFDPNKKSETAEISNIPSDKEENGHKLSSKRDDDVVSSLNLKLDNLDLNKTLITTTTTPPDAITSETSYSTENVRYLVDYTLNRLCRWLRILGIDAAIETESEEQLRTKEGKLKPLFDRCQKECRSLVTTSTKLAARNNCPPGTFLISPQVVPNLELALAQLLLLHGVALEPTKFLSRCVVCNGSIRDVTDTEEKRRVLTVHQAPEDLSLEMEVYECNGCGQGYWWNEQPMSSASRVKNQATRLLEVCLRAGVPIKGELGMFDFIDVDALRKEGWDGPEPLEHLDVIDWLNSEHLSHPIQLQSAYATSPSDDLTTAMENKTLQGDDNDKSGAELLPFTNVTNGFVGALDYVCFDQRSLTQTGRLYVPTTFAELNEPNFRNGHCLPSNIWPSDHLAVGARLTFQDMVFTRPKSMMMDEESVESATVAKEQPVDASSSDPPTPYCQSVENVTGTAQESVSSSPLSHGAVCACGCVPKIRSLFEMAELRRQAKLAKLQQGKVDTTY